MVGEKVKGIQVATVNGTLTRAVDLTPAKSGIYLIRITSPGNILTRKMIIGE
jgi:hypothetical protein